MQKLQSENKEMGKGIDGMTKEFSALQGIKLSKLENVEMTELLSTILLVEGQEKSSMRKVLKETLLILFWHQCRIQSQDGDSILFFFTPSYGGRVEHYKDFKRVLSCASKYISFSYERKFCFNISNIRYIWLWLKWISQLKVSKLSLAYRIHLANAVLSSYIYVKKLDEFCVQNSISPKLGVTFCDIHPVDYMITLYLNSKNVPTATLQHAVFEHQRLGWSNLFSHSTYFLGISQVAKYEAKLSGADVSKFLVLGPMKYIDGSNVKEKSYSNKVAGVALSGPVFEEQNAILLDYARQITKKYGYKFVVRAHPALNLEKYKIYLDEMIVFDDSNTMFQFAKKCDFVIMGPTNVFGDIIVTDTYAFRMTTDVDFYSCIEHFKFTDWDSLNSHVLQLREAPNKMKENLQNVKEMVCPSWDIRKAYTEFFDNFI